MRPLVLLNLQLKAFLIDPDPKKEQEHNSDNRDASKR